MKRIPAPQEQARMLVQMFAEQTGALGYQKALNLIARLNGHKNWSVMQAAAPTKAPTKHSSPTLSDMPTALPVRQHAKLRALAQAVVDSADNTGCSGDLTVVEASAIEALEDWLDENETLAPSAESSSDGDEEPTVGGFTVDDLLTVRPDLSREQAIEVILHCEHRFDASIGMNWEVLELQSYEVFGPFGVDAILVDGDKRTRIFVRLNSGQLLLGAHASLNGTHWWSAEEAQFDSKSAYVAIAGKAGGWRVALEGFNLLFGSETEDLQKLAEMCRENDVLRELKGPRD